METAVKLIGNFTIQDRLAPETAEPFRRMQLLETERKKKMRMAIIWERCRLTIIIKILYLVEVGLYRYCWDVDSSVGCRLSANTS